MTLATPKPVPRGDDLNGEFYDFCKQGELRFQRCLDCGGWRHMPRYTCAACGSDRWEWAKSAGRGRIYTWTVAHRAFHPAFEQDLPYAPVIVELDEGVRMVSQVVDRAPDALALDMPVTVAFEPRGEFIMPMFRAL